MKKNRLLAGFLAVTGAVSILLIWRGPFSDYRLDFSFYPRVLYDIIFNVSEGNADWEKAPELTPGVKHLRIVRRSPRPLVVNAVRIDLEAAGIRFHSTGQCDRWGSPAEWTCSGGRVHSYVRETASQRPSDFIAEANAGGMAMAAAVNALPWRPFDPGRLPFSSPSPEYVELTRLMISGGAVISEGAGPAFIVRKDNTAAIKENFSTGTARGVHTAVGGMWMCLVDDSPVPSGRVPPVISPKAGIGVSGDGRYVYFITADGRRLFSRGATTEELGEQLKYLGAVTGLRLDGGGSTAMVRWDAESNRPVVLNTPSDGFFILTREREVSSCVGVWREEPGLSSTD